MKKGTVILTKFPFTDLKAVKRRPAIVVSKTSNTKNDVIVAFVSTVISEKLADTDLLLDYKHKDFIRSGLKKTSIIKLDKLATLNTSIFTGELGTLSETSIEEINIKLKKALDID